MAIGDHLYVQYPTFQHHGIDIGDGTVIEYGGKGSGSMSVRRVPLGAFLARGPAFVKLYAPDAALPPLATVKLAFARLAEQRYDLFNNNCEHLAHWCKTGHHWSPQANTLKGGLAFGAVAFVAVLLASAAG